MANRLKYLLDIYGSPYELVLKILIKSFHFIHRCVLTITNRYRNKKTIRFILHVDEEEKREIYRRYSCYNHYSGDASIEESKNFEGRDFFTNDPILFMGHRSWLDKFWLKFRPGTFDIDYKKNAMDGWAWTHFTNTTDPQELQISTIRKRFVEKISKLKSSGIARCYVFGTGPSLDKAMNREWQDGYRIVCNTIVRDVKLWNHIVPDFIVAGDAIYHFGFTDYAKAFRRDLRARLKDSETMFAYPAQFHSIIRQEFADLEGKLIPIPSGRRKRVDIDLTQSFRLPALGNVLMLLLLPLACTLSKKIYLWGFDGRAPDDRLFWKNSNRHSYPELLDELQQAHPAFFAHNVPAHDPGKYARSVYGAPLEHCLQAAEKRGWYFEMIHPSWTHALQKRYHGDT